MTLATAEPTTEREKFQARLRLRPLAFARRLPWQHVAWALLGHRPWGEPAAICVNCRGELGTRSAAPCWCEPGMQRALPIPWGPPPTMTPRVICVPTSNRTGKTTLLGQAVVAHSTGRHPRWNVPGEVWGGMPTLGDSVEFQRPAIERWLGGEDGAEWWPARATLPAQSVLRTRAGWRVMLRAYMQDRHGNAGGGHWESGRCQFIAMDEPAPDHILSAARARLIDDDGTLLAVFTPLGGTGGALYKECHEPWLAYIGRHPGAKWGEVRPGTWVMTVGQRANARSVGGFLPDARIDEEEAALIRMGRMLEARVRYHGEWLDTSEDRLIPAELLNPWGGDVPGAGWAEVVAWIDTATSIRTSADETAIAVWARSQGDPQTAGLYQLASEHGRWEPGQKLQRVCATLIAHGCPNTWVDKQNGDVEFAASVNRELARMGYRPCVQVAPHATINKVATANLFAPIVAARRAWILPQHLDGPESFGSQARLFSASYRGHDDTLDCGMKAALRLVSYGDNAAAARAMELAEVKRDEDDDDDSHGSWRMSEGMRGPD